MFYIDLEKTCTDLHSPIPGLFSKARPEERTFVMLFVMILTCTSTLSQISTA